MAPAFFEHPPASSCPGSGSWPERLAPSGPFLVRVDEARRRPGKPRTLKQRAVALLARREYARGELAARLAAVGGAPDAIEALLDELELRGLLSDERFAGTVARQKAGGFARRAIVRELRERGVAREVADAAAAEAGASDDVMAAETLGRRRFGSPPADDREKARQLRFLVSRGFAVSVAYAVLRRAGARVDEE
jgi:regulatory protein